MTCDEARSLWINEDGNADDYRRMLCHMWTCEWCDEFARKQIALEDMEDIETAE